MTELFEVDELKVYRGQDLVINNKIRLRQPTLGEIEGSGSSEFTEKNFFQTVHTLISTPSDMFAQLDECGINYEDLTNFDLFMLLFPQMDVEDIRLIFGDGINPKNFRREYVTNEDRYVLADKENEIFVDEIIYQGIVQYLCLMFGTKQSDPMKIGNGWTKQVMLQAAKDEAEAQKSRPYKSILKPLISSLVNHEGFKYGWDNVWEMKFAAFMDAVSRIQAISSARALLGGCYNGTIDMKKINKNELNYMRDLSH